MPLEVKAAYTLIDYDKTVCIRLLGMDQMRIAGEFMKKGFIFVITLFLCASVFLCSASAQSGEYKIDDLKMTLALPDGLMVLKRDIPEGDPILTKISMAKADLLNTFSQKNIYLLAKPEGAENTFEIIVTMVKNDDIGKIFDYKKLRDYYSESGAKKYGTADEYMETIAQGIAEGLNKSNPDVKWTYESVASRPQAVFFVINTEYEAQGEKIYGLQYSTIINKQGINITLNSYGSPVSAEQKTMLEDTINGVNFTEIQEPPQGYFKGLVPSNGVNLGGTLIPGMIAVLCIAILIVVFKMIKKRRSAKYRNMNQ